MQTLQRPSISFLLFLFFGLAVGLVVACAPVPPPPEILQTSTEGLLITDVTLISPERTLPLEGAWVGVRDGLVTHIGSGEPPTEIADWPQWSGEGRYLIPGLIDSHVHLNSIPGMAWDQQREHRDLVDAYMAQLPRSYLYYGFTTLIDLAPRQADAFDDFRRQPLAPDVLGCGGPVPLANGYPMAFVPEAFRFKAYENFLFDPRQAESIPSSVDPREHSPRAIADRIAEGDGICIKAFVEDGFGLDASWPVPTVDMIKELRQEAHRIGRPLLVHANSFDAYGIALAGQADILVHGLWTWDAHQKDDDGTTLPTAVADTIDQLRQSQTAVMPTLRVLGGDRALFDPEFLQDPALQAVLPNQLIDWYGSDEGGWFRRQMQEGQPPETSTPQEILSSYDRVVSRSRRTASAMVQAGVPVLLGSDTPSGPSYGNPPGYNGYLEMQELARAGLSPPAVLAAATLDNANALGLEDRYGSVEVGKVANLLLLNDNPLDSVDAYATLHAVVLRGDVLDREKLAANGARRGD